MNKYFSDESIKEINKLPKKNRFSFYSLLTLATVLVAALIIWSASADCGQSMACGMAMAIFLISTFAYVFLIDIVIIIGFEKNKFKDKSFRFLLISVILSLPLVYGNFFLKDYLHSRSFNATKRKTLELRAIATQYISEKNMNGCIEYVSNNKYKEESYLFSAADIRQFCEDILGYQEAKLIETTQDINLCTTDYCYYEYALIWRDIAACYKINETKIDYYHNSWSTLLKDNCLTELNKKLDKAN